MLWWKGRKEGKRGLVKKMMMVWGGGEWVGLLYDTVRYCTARYWCCTGAVLVLCCGAVLDVQYHTVLDSGLYE